MNSYHYNEHSALRRCVRHLLNTDDALTVDEIAPHVNFSVTACRNALNIAIRDGYVKHGDEKKKCCPGQGNLKITYRCTGKLLPEPKPITERTERERQDRVAKQAEIEAGKATDFAPFRHPQDEAFFGPAPKVWTGSWQSKARVFRQPMTVTNDEMEVA